MRKRRFIALVGASLVLAGGFGAATMASASADEREFVPMNFTFESLDECEEFGKDNQAEGRLLDYKCVEEGESFRILAKEDPGLSDGLPEDE